jgi:uncharacterized protein
MRGNAPVTWRALLLGLSVGVASIVGTLHAQAPDPARLAAAKQMLANSGGVKQFEDIISLMFDDLAANFAAMAPGKEQEVNEVVKGLAPRFKARLAEVWDQVAALYARELSKEELDALAAFFKSPLGLKLVDTQAKTMREVMQAGQEWGMQVGVEIDAEARKELEKRGIALQ